MVQGHRRATVNAMVVGSIPTPGKEIFPFLRSNAKQNEERSVWTGLTAKS